MFVYNFVDPNLRVGIFFQKDWGQKKRALILKQVVEARRHTFIGGWRKFHTRPVMRNCFFLVKAFESSLGIYFHPSIIEFFCLTSLQLIIEEMIHRKTVIGFREKRIGNCSAQEVNYLSRGRIFLGELEVRKKRCSMCKIFCNSSEDLETRNQQAHDQHNEDTCYG